MQSVSRTNPSHLRFCAVPRQAPEGTKAISGSFDSMRAVLMHFTFHGQPDPVGHRPDADRQRRAAPGRRPWSPRLAGSSLPASVSVRQHQIAGSFSLGGWVDPSIIDWAQPKFVDGPPHSMVSRLVQWTTCLRPPQRESLK